jgi:hypothetical protein
MGKVNYMLFGMLVVFVTTCLRTGVEVYYYDFEINVHLHCQCECCIVFAVFFSSGFFFFGVGGGVAFINLHC